MHTAQKMKFSIKDFFSKCDQISRKLKFSIKYFFSKCEKKFKFTEEILNENFIFCAVAEDLYFTFLKTLVSRNAGDKKNLHLGGCTFFSNRF